MNLWTVRHEDLRRAQAQQLAEILQDADPDDPALHPQKTFATAAGDERKLRGIPAIGRGVTGAIYKTKPGWNLDGLA